MPERAQMRVSRRTVSSCVRRGGSPPGMEVKGGGPYFIFAWPAA